MEKEYSLIKELHTSSKETKLTIRVMRLWEVVNLYNDNKVSFDMILMDEQGDQIHASIRHDMFKSVSNVIEEGAILYLEDFKVQDRSKNFRPIDYKYKIMFDEKTTIKAPEGEFLFPPLKFSFLDFKDIPSRNNITADLIDVIGFCSESDEIQNKNTKLGSSNLKDIYISDNDGNVLRIAFWGETIKQIPDDVLNVEKQNVIIVTSTYVRSFKTKYHLQASLATKIYVNLDIAEVDTFRNRGSKPPEKLMLAKKRTRTDFEEKKEVDDKKNIKEIMSAITDISSKDFYSCAATITKVHKNRGWYYTSCKKCLKIVKMKDDGHWCFSCRDFVDKIERFKIQFEIEDETGTMDVTVFTDRAEELIGHSFDLMMEIMNQENDDAVFEMIEKNVIGKRNTFTLKISSYNRQNPMSSLTVTKIVTIEADVKKEKGKQVEIPSSSSEVAPGRKNVKGNQVELTSSSEVAAGGKKGKGKGSGKGKQVENAK